MILFLAAIIVAMGMVYVLDRHPAVNEVILLCAVAALFLYTVLQ